MKRASLASALEAVNSERPTSQRPGVRRWEVGVGRWRSTRFERLHRLAAMDAAEIRFRLVSASRRRMAQTRAALVPPRWRRADLRLSSTPALDAARRALAAGRWNEAHRVLAGHFGRSQRLPVNAGTLPALAAAIRERFPGAAADAAARAARIRAGSYDVLGHEDVDFGAPPAWHHDPVHHRSAPRTFWSSVPYLDPACGDHKVIWELNRHQHWLALARSRALNDDRRCYTTFVDQLESWMADNPPLLGVNWASMLEIGFRSLSWIWALYAFSADAIDDEPDAAPWMVDLLLGAERQLEHVERNLSHYFSPNTHLSGEALALYVAGHVLPELGSSERFAAVGRGVLLAEIDRQIGRDGLQAELSAHYHRYTTDFYLLALMVARSSGDPAARVFEATARQQARALRVLADDTGRLPLLGDDDGGQLFPVCGREPVDASPTLAAAALLLDDPSLAVGDAPEEVWWFAGMAAASAAQPFRPAPQGWPSSALTDGGYYVARNARGDHLIFDAGPHGYLNGGHAHADALSVVLTLEGHPLFVDPGTATYTMNPEMRDRFRSTAMHNTVVVNGRSQSEPRGPFDWHTRATARASAWHSGAGYAYVEGAHDGYAPAVHRRAVLALDGFGWIVVDRVAGGGHASVEAFWHLHPDWTPSTPTDGAVYLVHRSGHHSAIATSAERVHLLPQDDERGLSLFAPVYGRLVGAPTLMFSAAGALPQTIATFIAADRSLADDVRVRLLPVETAPGSGWAPVAVLITCAQGSATVLVALDTEDLASDVVRAVPLPMDRERARWGAAGVRTDGRAAAVIERRGATEAVLIDGRTLTLQEKPALAPRGSRSSARVVVPSRNDDRGDSRDSGSLHSVFVAKSTKVRNTRDQ